MEGSKQSFLRCDWQVCFARAVKVLCLFLCLVPAIVARAQFTFTTNNGAITITGYTGSGNTTVTVPSTTNGLPVGTIGSFAFLSCTGLISVTIPNSVTNYPGFAFVNCSNLLAVYFQGNAPIDFPGGGPVFWRDPNATLYYLQGSTGWKAALDTLPTVQWDPLVLTRLVYTTNNGTITVTGYTGAGGAVVIPSTINGLPVASIGSNAFYNCTSLTGITLPNTVTNLGNLAFAGCTSLAGVTIPNSAPGSGVFSNCTALTNVVISINNTTIAGSEFAGCPALTTLMVPSSITNLGDWAFQNCSSLNRVYYQGNAPVADSTVFSGDNIETNYYYPKTSGWGTTFAGRPTAPILFSYTTNSGAITIQSYIGIDGTVTIPDSLNGLPVTALGNTSFYACATLTNINIGAGVTSIAGQAFVGCANLLAINVDPNNSMYSSVNGVLFDESQATILYYPGGRAGSYTIPKGVTAIPSYAFQGCAGLTSLTVSASVTSIGTLAFNLDPDLTTIYFDGDAPAFAWSAFLDTQNTVTVYYVPDTSGWDTNSSGLPAALWLPQAQSGDASFGLKTNQFGFNINWVDGRTVVVEAATDLANPIWTPVGTNTLTDGSSFFSDPQWTNYPGRYYRIRSP
jgi:hypothetical protein